MAADIAAAGGTVETAQVDAFNQRAVEQHVDAVAAKAGGIDIWCLAKLLLGRASAFFHHQYMALRSPIGYDSATSHEPSMRTMIKQVAAK